MCKNAHCPSQRLGWLFNELVGVKPGKGAWHRASFCKCQLLSWWLLLLVWASVRYRKLTGLWQPCAKKEGQSHGG